MKRFLNHITIFIAASFVILFGYAQFCEWFFNQRNYFPDDSRRSWAMKQYGGNYDYAVLGSSRAEGAFDMHLLDSIAGQKGINIASNGSGFVDNYLVLYAFLKNNNHIKTLYLQVDNYSLDPEANFSNAFHVFNFLPFWKDTTYQKPILHHLSEKDQFIFSYTPWLRYYVYNKYFSPVEVSRRIILGRKKSKRMDQQLKGNSAVPVVNKDSARFFHKAASDSFSVNPFDVAYLEKIFSLCKENSIELRCFTAPDFAAQKKRFSNYEMTEQQLHKILQRHHIQLMPSAFDEKQMNDINLFKDPEHLNVFGVWIHTKSFASVMTKE